MHDEARPERRQQDLETGSDLARQAQVPQPGLVREFWDFLRENSKWWLVPILIVLALVAVVAVIGSSAAGSFIYTLF